MNGSILTSFLSFDWKIAALIAERNDLGQPAPVVYVSGEEVSIYETSYWLVVMLKALFCHTLLVLFLFSNSCLACYFHC